jgi:hypothetical protein
VVYRTWRALLEVLGPMSCEGPHVLGPREVYIDDGECGNFLYLRTACYLGRLVSESHGSKVGSNAHNRVLFVHASVCIPQHLLRWDNRSGRVESKPIWPDGDPLTSISLYQAQWLDIKHVDKSDVLGLLVRETLLDSKLRTSLSPTQSVCLAILPSPRGYSIASVLHI